jgi:PPK2 family polyphosphate:nucleotide phosphotransferase
VKHADHFRVPPHDKVHLRDIDPSFHGKYVDPNAASAAIAKNVQRLHDLQGLLYADHRRSALVCLQGLDAAGKDGTIEHVFSAVNPQGVDVSQFKVPTPQEQSHDFLWRIHQRTPRAGQIAIFNRSHYEDVLVARVHGTMPKSVWSRRYDRINEFEENLVDGGTAILKFYLHISPEEQLRRFEARLTDPRRTWKISEADYAERKFWPAYVEAYEDIFRKTSTKHAPWYIVPANHKWFRNLAVAAIIVQALESLGLSLPKPSVDLEAIARKYHSAKDGELKLGKRIAKKK